MEAAYVPVFYLFDRHWSPAPAGSRFVSVPIMSATGFLGGHDERLRIGMVSSAPPTRCGIATFNEALGAEFQQLGHHVGVVRVQRGGRDGDGPPSAFVEIGQLRGLDYGDCHQASAALNRCDIVFIEHEFGIYAGADGDSLLSLLALLEVPTVVILHTVLSAPSAHQADVMARIIDSVSAIVVLTQGALRTLQATFDLRAVPVVVIAHGARVDRLVQTRPRGVRPLLLTWGLLGPGKGIEWAIDAMAELVDVSPLPLYVVAGQTHPNVLDREGESYREMLHERVRAAGLESMVVFENRYRDLGSLHQLIVSADVVVLPYDTTEQATSGVLVDAVAAGRPVVATDFPHSRELLADGAGLLVRQRDPHEIAQVVRLLLTNSAVHNEMAAAARRTALSLDWRAVATAYVNVAHDVLSRSKVNA
jgi:glycosyltransferase involved in cell wall biosynthesis